MVLLILQPAYAHAQGHRLAGTVIDGISRRAVPYATVVLVEARQKTTTDEHGEFLLEGITEGRYTLSIHHIAYAALERALITVPAAESLLIVLEPAILQTDEVVVRSTRTPTSSNTTPYPLNIELHDAIVGSPAVTIADALQRIPGLALVRDGSWETAISIRGMSRSNIVAVVDDARIETANDIAGALSLINMHDLERVEVLKSPASTHHGTGAIGGVVQFVTKRPQFTDDHNIGGEVSSEYSSVNGETGQYVAVEATNDRYALRLSGGLRNAGDTRTPEGALANSEFHDHSLLGTFNVRLGDSQTASVTYQRVQANDTGIPGGAPIAVAATARYTRAFRELFGAEYRMPNLSSLIPLVVIRAQRQEIARNVEIQNPNQTRVTPHATHTTLSTSAEASFTPSADVLVTGGLEVWQRELDSRRERWTATSVSGERPIPHSRYLSAGLFVQGEWSVIPDQLTATAGARYDRIRISSDEARNPEYIITGGVFNGTPSGQRLLWSGTSAYDGSWSAHTGIRFAASRVVDLTALTTAAFRSPSLEERFEYIDLGNVVYVGNPALSSERSLCLDAGVRVHTGLLRVRCDAFYNSLSNLVAQLPGTFEGRPAYYRQNIGRARLAGFEVDAEQGLAAWAVLAVSAAYVRGRDTYAGADLPQVPPLSGRVALRGVLQGVGTASIEIPWAATQVAPGPGEPRTSGYATLNAGVSSHPMILGGLTVTVRAELRNIMDAAYRNHLSTLRGIVRCEPGRNAALSATLLF
jgi:hemoglobin/transferrin/lactoferrin receptor protein